MPSDATPAHPGEPTDPRAAALGNSWRVRRNSSGNRATSPSRNPNALRDVALAVVVSRVVIVLAGVLAVEAFGLSPRAGGFDPAGLTSGYGAVADRLLAPFARWDSVWFLQIAADGYDGGARSAFFPLYPMLTGGAGALISSDIVAGIAVSLTGLAVGLWALHHLVSLDFGATVARRTVWLVALAPMSLFFSAVYSEGLYLGLSVGAFLAARHDRWALAGLIGGAAAATRSAGLLIAVPLLIIWFKRSPRRLIDVAWLALIPAGLGAYCAGLALAGLDPTSPFSAQDVWFRSFAGPFVGAWDGTVAAAQGARQLLSGAREPVYFTANGGDPFVVARENLHLFAWLVLVVPATIGVLRRLPIEYGAYTVAALALPLSYPVQPQPLMSLPRFVLVLFPLAIWLALWCDNHRWRQRTVVAASTAGLVAATGVFSTWHWLA